MEVDWAINSLEKGTLPSCKTNVLKLTIYHSSATMFPADPEPLDVFANTTMVTMSVAVRTDHASFGSSYVVMMTETYWR